jgi:CRISPR/Cas system-associated endoribonuclease Cas2
MPRTSRKSRFLGSLTKALNKRLQQRALRTINDDEDSFADAVDLADGNQKRVLKKILVSKIKISKMS